jgi:hypothetical protein
MDSTGRKIVNPVFEGYGNKSKKMDKSQKKAAEEYERYLESIKLMKVKVPPARVKHDKTDA